MRQPADGEEWYERIRCNLQSCVCIQLFCPPVKMYFSIRIGLPSQTPYLPRAPSTSPSSFSVLPWNAQVLHTSPGPPRSTQGTPITGVQSHNGISGKGRLLFQTFLFLAIVMNRKSQNWHMCVIHSTNNQVLWVDKDGVSLTTATFHSVKRIWKYD